MARSSKDMAKPRVTFGFKVFARAIHLFMWTVSLLGLAKTATAEDSGDYLCDPSVIGTATADCALLEIKDVPRDYEDNRVVGLHLDSQFSNTGAIIQQVTKSCAPFFTVAASNWDNNVVYLSTKPLMTFCNNRTFYSTSYATVKSTMTEGASVDLLSAGAKECLENIIIPECPTGFAELDFGWQMLIIGGSLVVGLGLIKYFTYRLYNSSPRTSRAVDVEQPEARPQGPQANSEVQPTPAAPSAPAQQSVGEGTPLLPEGQRPPSYNKLEESGAFAAQPSAPPAGPAVKGIAGTNQASGSHF